MTRIFDALKKARPAAAEPPRSPMAPVPPLPAPEHVTRMPAPSPIARAMRPAPLPAHLAAPASRSWAAAPGIQPSVVPLREGYELPAEVVREMTKLRVSIEALLLDRQTRRIIFLGSQAGEGTTTVAYQFAFTLARDSRLRTLYLDAHARRPSIHAAEPGAREAAPAASLEGGRALPARGGEARGVVDAWPLAEQFESVGLLSPEAVREALEWGASGYDWIIVDGPPVLESPDAAPIAAVADGVVMVIEAGRTKKPVLQRAVELLRKAGARVLGSVLNRRRLEIPGFIYRRI